MRSDEQLKLEQFLAVLQQQSEVSVRMVLTKAEDSWAMRGLVLTVGPDVSSPEWSCYDYGEIVFLAKQLTGAQIVAWLQRLGGELDGYRFSISELNEQVRGERLPSHARYRGFDGLWQPHSTYELYFKVSSPEPAHNREPLVQDGCPSFPTVGVGVFKLLFDREASPDHGFPNVGIELRIAHTAAWIDGVELRSNSVRVTIKGNSVSGMRLELTGPPDIRFDKRLTHSGSIEFLFPEGLPSKLWLLLSRGNRWLDLRDLNQYGTSSPWEDVVNTLPDLGTLVAGAIARGEGEQTEFKEIVPPQDERMLKTVAAFANGRGGMVVLGVVNGTGEIRGLSCDIGEQKDRIKQMIRSKVHPEPKTQVEHCEVRGKILIAITVDEGDEAPYGIGPDPEHLTYYVRRGATTPSARQSEIRNAARKKM
jgi:hypothetical protein